VPLPRRSLPHAAPTGLSPLQEHARRWGRGCGADICRTATNVCLVRGTVPCQVLLVGEAPGAGEDALGQPFVGPAGHLLDGIIARALGGKWTHALTNLVGCQPLEDGRKAEDGPPDDAVRACSGRLKELVRLCDGWHPSLSFAPTNKRTIQLLVTVGKHSATWLRQGFKDSVELHRRIPTVGIVHPAWALRQNEVIKMNYATRSVVTIQTALEQRGKIAAEQAPVREEDIPF
jgi:uracil-DNA glycosylase family 4